MSSSKKGTFSGIFVGKGAALQGATEVQGRDCGRKSRGGIMDYSILVCEETVVGI